MKWEGTRERKVVKIPSLPWFVQIATQVWSMQAAQAGFQEFTQNVWSEIIFCKETKTRYSKPTSWCKDTVYTVFFFPCNKMSAMAIPIPILSTWKLIMGWDLSAVAPPRFQLSGHHFTFSSSPWLGAGIHIFQQPHNIVLQVFKPKLKIPKKNYFREVSILNRSANNEAKVIWGDGKLLWYRWKAPGSATAVLVGGRGGWEKCGCLFRKRTRKLHVSESLGHTALSRDTNHTLLRNRIKHCQLNQ